MIYYVPFFCSKSTPILATCQHELISELPQKQLEKKKKKIRGCFSVPGRALVLSFHRFSSRTWIAPSTL